MKMNKPAEKYWICQKCADGRKLYPFKTGNTLILDRCGWCESEKKEYLTPLVDLRKARNLESVPGKDGERWSLA
jgi:hypothetical protein